jgi:hypothetical protein
MTVCDCAWQPGQGAPWSVPPADMPQRGHGWEDTAALDALYHTKVT